MNKIAVVAVIFPSNLPFFDCFLTSVELQTIHDFDLIIINDGIENFSAVAGEKRQIIKEIINVNGSPFEIRIKAIQEVQNRGYKKIIFSDTDDVLSINRVEVLSNSLDHYPIVCNDLDIINEKGKVLERNYWKSRLGEKLVFNKSFLTDKNILGFGNCGLRLDINFPQLDVYPNVTAPDWLFFYLTLNQSKDAFFTSECRIGYRQHINNVIGLKTVTKDRLLKAINCKIEHFSELNRYGFDFSKDLDEHLELKKTVLSNALWVEKVLKEIKEKKLNLFWWEETNYLI